MRYVPYDALEYNQLDHESASEAAVHGAEQRNAHDKGVGESGEGEESDEPVEAAAAATAGDGGEWDEEGEDEELGEGVGEEEAEVHLVRVVLGDEVEGEDGDGEGGDEAVDARALAGAEHVPPPDGGVGEEHCEVEGDHGAHHAVEVLGCYHLVRFSSIFWQIKLN